MNYEKHEMNVVSFDNKEVFAFITPTASESGTSDYGGDGPSDI